ncbi:MAG TPA: response regulator [Rubrivivax sp.]|nr:response regulator [Pseudomonadota bacterium]MCW5639358.1 response regulator [Rubrivivax sp.]HRY88848.1 response regulator [Rubrivivax sp.]HRZ62115.1 response regulator [Rubrivivax sp.]
MSSPTPLVAVVDDDAEVRAALVRLVASTGHAGRAYASGEAFLQDVDSHRPQCVVLDLHMPGASGFDVLQALARRHIDVPVLTITGYDSAEARATALRLGAQAYLCKPVDEHTLLSAIAAALRPGPCEGGER